MQRKFMTIKNHMLKSILTLGLMFSISLSAQASSIVQYDISSTVAHPDRSSPSLLDRKITTTSLLGNGTTFDYSSSFSTDSLAVKAAVATTDLADALANNTYLSFRVTADSGCALSLDSLSFGAYPGGSSARSFYVFSSVDGFAEGQELLSVNYNASATGVNSYSIDLSNLDGYGTLSTVEFRIYVRTDSVNKSINLSDITVEGDVTTVIAQYDISSTSEHPSRYAPSVVSSNISAANLSDVGTTFAYSSSFSTDSLVMRAATATSDLTGALTAGTYMSFSVTSDMGNEFSLDSLSFGAYPGGSSARAFYLFSSVDGFVEGQELLGVSYNATASGVTHYHVDLGSLGYDDLPRGTPVEFRVYVQADSTSRSINLSNLTLAGRVTPILAGYDISATTEHPNRQTPSTIDGNATASSLTDVGTVSGYSSAFSTDSLAVKAALATTDVDGALSNGTYMAFTVSADSGYSLALDSLSFGAYPGGSSIRSFYVFSSVDGFVAGQELLGISYNDTATGVNLYRIDLANRSEYSYLDSVEFRIYVQADSTGKSINLSDINVCGEAVLPVTITASSDWLVLTNFTTDIVSNSVFDFSFLCDAPAGKYGPVVLTSAGHFEFTSNVNERVRFRGVNLVGSACFLDHTTANLVADRLVRSGYNAVRFHHFDRELQVAGAASGQLDAVKLEKLDYLFNALKSRGIYIDIDLFSLRTFNSSELVSFGLPADAAAGLSGGEAAALFKAVLPFSDAAFTAWAAFSDALLEHTNSYTGLTWAEDPALIGVCPVNEDVASPTIELDPLLSDLYASECATWLGEDDHQDIYDRDGYDGAFGRFVIEAHCDSEQRLMNHLVSLGVNAPLTGSNHRNFQGLTSLRQAYDCIDNHQYWDHPTFPENRFQLPFRFRQKSVVTAAASTPRLMMPTRILNKPYAVTEFNYVSPNRYRSEGGIVMSAYASLQDWDGLYNFDYANFITNGTGKISDNFSISVDPVGLLGDRLSSLIFLDENVSSATGTIVFAVEDLTAFSDREVYFSSAFNSLGLVTRIASLTNAPEDIIQLAGVSAVVVDSDSSSVDTANHIYAADSSLFSRLLSAGILPAGSIDPAGRCFQSATGQIELDSIAGTLQAISPRSELFVLPPSSELEGSLVSVTNQDEFCSVFVASVDQAPLVSSQRILVLHLSDALLSGTQFSDEHRTLLKVRGDWPMLVQRASTDITLHLPTNAVLTAWAVGLDGTRLYTVPLEAVADGWVLHAQTDGTGGAQLAYEIIRQ